MKKHHVFHLSIILLSLLAVLAWIPDRAFAQPETLTIAAANSLKDALRTLLPAFELQHPAVTVRVIYGPSQSLRKQIEEGAPVDVFLPSLSEEIDQLEKKGLIIQGTKRIYAGTSLVLITGPVLPAPIRSIEICARFPSGVLLSAIRRLHRWGKSRRNFSNSASSILHSSPNTSTVNILVPCWILSPRARPKSAWSTGRTPSRTATCAFSIRRPPNPIRRFSTGWRLCGRRGTFLGPEILSNSFFLHALRMS